MTPGDASPLVLLTWRDHPAARRPGAAVIAGIVIIAFAAALGLAFDSAIWAVVSIAVLFISLNRFFLPSAFTIDEQGLTARFPFSTRRIEWRHVRRMEVTRYNLLLASSAKRSLLSGSRESRAPFGGRKKTILELVRARVRDEVWNASLPQEGTQAAN
ncbi:MAG: PH domain-containing protein [Phycisphaerales bacterium]|nr:PH domain-containing protein [Phycisphaerales bacterium]